MNDGTLKVTPIESKMPQPAARFTITATLDGFPFTVEAEGKAEDLRALVGRLKAIGAEPPKQSQPVTVSGPTKAADNDDAPVCEFHGKMKRSNHGGFYCPKKMGDGSYCKSKA
jgi:hypothetical protein